MSNRLTYADECLERAEKATYGPWVSVTCSNNLMAIRDAGGLYVHSGYFNFITDAEFTAAARTDVPELARRLKKACELLRQFMMDEHSTRDYSEVDELEAPLER